MSTLKGNLGQTVKGDDDSSMSDNSSDHEYELQEIRPEVYNSKSSLAKRKRKQCCSFHCVFDWILIVIAFSIFYTVNGLFTWGLMMALLSNTQNTLIAFGVIWVVLTTIWFTFVYIVSERVLKERLAHAAAVAEEDRKRREENEARNKADNS